ncbi:DUF4375 domain-containing protein [Mucilaginibacter sp. OK098]|uniref:DMP19 family protein n=1 Tax=Mucilaginibacter sp. OK098 TaxID=1855297 RepID=UPI00091FB32A|nr:DUF4375 domain-containing protein [Mucilaginibacter sp. OK098]SHM03981.1 protein of unknown function [Mucilaginibacter sp. OK098]
MFTSLFKWLGLFQKKNDQSKNDLTEQITQPVESFKNRNIYKKLTSEIINNSNDDQLLQIVFDNLSGKLSDDYTEEYEAVLTFSKAQQAIYIIWCLEAEVNNGGFNQYYFNSSGQFASLTPDALQLVGAHKFSALTAMANNIYETEYSNITKYQDGTLEGFSKSYNDNPLNEFDNEFYELYKVENLQQLQIDFIRRNLFNFIEE